MSIHDSDSSSYSSENSSNLVAAGDIIYIESRLRKHKFVKKFLGPYQVIAKYGTYVYCYSYLKEKHKRITMNRVRILSCCTA